MKKTRMDDNWRFIRADGGESVVHLPHDAQVSEPRGADCASGSGGAYYKGGFYTYKREFAVEKRAGYIEFEGVYQWAEVTLNGQLIGKRPYGYSSFVLPITEWLKENNEVVVTANNAATPNSRWYSGAGIYRHVNIYTGGDVHIPPRGVRIKVSSAKEHSSTISIATDIVNLTALTKRVIVKHTAYYGENAVANAEAVHYAQGATTVIKSLDIAPARLWSPDQPSMYALKTQLISDGDVLDETITRFGLREVYVNATEGFVLNGAQVKMRGGCVHHDNGPLGSAAFDRAEWRKVELLKASGYNAIRTSHNPPSPVLLNACDELGMLVIDETFDCWRTGKNAGDYHLFFEDWWERDTQELVLRDMNHPSVIMWSIGNEVSERDGRSCGAEWAKKQAECVRKLDDTRPITSALCLVFELLPPDLNHSEIIKNGYIGEDDAWGAATEGVCDALDVVGYNYLKHRYAYDRVKYPQRVICATETFPSQAYEYWRGAADNASVIGDFVWTAWDYIGEAAIGRSEYDNPNMKWVGDYPWLLAHCGDIDICGNKRPQSHFRDTLWGMRSAPYICAHHPENFGKTPSISAWAWNPVTESWSFPGHEGRPIRVEVYSDADQIELKVNDVPVGTVNVEQNIAAFDAVWQPGVVTATAFIGGAEVSKSEMKSCGQPYAIALTADAREIPAEHRGLSFVQVAVVDKDGALVPYADDKITFVVSGAGVLQAVGSANPITEESFVSDTRCAYGGRALAIVRSQNATGEITLTATSPGIKSAKVTIAVV